MNWKFFYLYLVIVKNEYKNHQTYWKIYLGIFSILNEDKFFYLIILERFTKKKRKRASVREKKNNEREEENEEEKGEKAREAETSRRVAICSGHCVGRSVSQ